MSDDQVRLLETLRRSEERLRLALDAGFMGAWDWDMRTNALEWAGHLEAIHGLAPGTFKGTFEAFTELVHPDDRPLLQAAIETAIRDRREFSVEFRNPRPDGSIGWVVGRGGVIFDETGQPVRMVGIGLDVTERRRAEDTARFLADATAALVEVLDLDETFDRVAALAVPHFADWCVVDLADEQGQLRRVSVRHADPAKMADVQEYVRSTPYPNEDRGAMRVFRTGRAEFMREIPATLIEAAAISPRHAELLRSMELRSYICVPMRARDRVLGVLTFVTADSGRLYDERDVAVAEELATRAAIAIDNVRLYDQLRKDDRRKDEFLALLAHELRNPLAPLAAALEILQAAAATPPDRQRAIHQLSRQLGHLIRLVDDLLDISRIRHGKVELRLAATTLDEILTRAVETVQPDLTRKAQALTLDAPDGQVPLVADGVRMAQVVANLLSNASKYSPERTEICVTARVEDHTVTIAVRDQGIGIPPERLASVFDIFSQGPDREGGLGLGLFLVRALAEMHGGTVVADSAGAGQGSTFTLRFPLRQPAADEPGPSRPASQPGSGRRVLVVDDNADSVETMSLLLQMNGHDVRTAGDAEEALDVARAFRPEVGLFDIGLPGVDGYELARRVRALEPEGERAVLVALTGWGGAEIASKAREAGFDHHLVKPAQWDALLKILGETPA